MLYIKLENNIPVKITDPSTIGIDPTIIQVKENIPPYIKGRQNYKFINLDITKNPPEANYNIVNISVNERKLALIASIEFLKEKNIITLETAFQRIDAITNCITHDDIDAFEQSIQQS